MYKQTLGTVEIAKLIGMSRITVHSWVVKGELKAIRTPGRHFRVRPGDLVEFLEQRGAPIPEPLRSLGARRCVLIGADEPLGRQVAELLEGVEDGGAKIAAETYIDPVEALMVIGASEPNLVAIRISLSQVDALEAIRSIRRRYPKVKILGLSNGAPARSDGPALDAGVNETLSIPCPPQALATRIQEMILLRR